MPARTIPPPSELDKQLAAQWLENGAVEAVAQLMAESRWLRNLTHPQLTQVKRGAQVPQSVENLQAIMAQDAITIAAQAAEITQLRHKLHNMEQKR